MAERHLHLVDKEPSIPPIDTVVNEVQALYDGVEFGPGVSAIRIGGTVIFGAENEVEHVSEEVASSGLDSDSIDTVQEESTNNTAEESQLGSTALGGTDVSDYNTYRMTVTLYDPDKQHGARPDFLVARFATRVVTPVVANTVIPPVNKYRLTRNNVKGTYQLLHELPIRSSSGVHTSYVQADGIQQETLGLWLKNFKPH